MPGLVDQYGRPVPDPVPVAQQPVGQPGGVDAQGRPIPAASPNGYTLAAPAIAGSPDQEAVPTYDPGQYNNGPIGGAGARPTATTRAVGGNELVSNQLNALTSGDSPYLQQARLQANNFSSSRGLLSSGIAAGNAESAAIQAALPIASQDASTYGTTAAQNMAAQNTASIAGAQNVTQGNIAGMNARTNLTGQQMQIGASREQNAIARNQTSAENYLNRQQQTQSQTSQQNFLADQAQRNNDFAATQNQLNRNFDSSEATRNFYRQTTAAALSTVFGSPEYMRDPAGASGLINFFTTQIESLYPDFGAPSGANGAPGTPPVPPATNAPPPVAPPPAVMQPNPGG